MYVTWRFQECYTRVLMGHVDLAMMKFLAGLYGMNIKKWRIWCLTIVRNQIIQILFEM